MYTLYISELLYLVIHKESVLNILFN